MERMTMKEHKKIKITSRKTNNNETQLDSGDDDVRLKKTVQKTVVAKAAYTYTWKKNLPMHNVIYLICLL